MQISRLLMQSKTPLLKCVICQEPDQPTMCPACAQIICEPCLYLSDPKSECPSCKSKTPHTNFIPSRCILSLYHHIEPQVRETVEHEIVMRQEQKEKCIDHLLPTNYYCVDCTTAICSDCGMLSSQHQGHKFISYRQIYQNIKRKVFDEFYRFDKKIAVCEDRKMFMRNKIEHLYEDYRRYKKIFEESYLAYTEKIEEKGKQIEEKIILKGTHNTKQLNKLQRKRDDVYDEIEKKTQLTLIKQSDQITSYIASLTEEEFKEGKDMGEDIEIEDNLDVLRDIVPEYTIFRYQLEGLSAKTGIIYSDSYFVNGVEWRLKIYPKGNGIAKDKFLSVFVEMTKSFVNQNKYEYKIELINPVDQLFSIRREYCSNFEMGECWGYNQFQPLDELQEKQFIKQDTIQFEIGIRNRTVRSLSDDKKRYILHLKEKIIEKQKYIKEKRVEKERYFNEKTIEKERQKQLIKKPQEIKRINLRKQVKESKEETVVKNACELSSERSKETQSTQKTQQKIQEEDFLKHLKKHEAN